MSFATNIQGAFTRVATEFKSIRTLISGSGTGDISGLSTTNKSSLVGAINELYAGGGVSSGVTDLDGLSDVEITTPVAGDILRHDGVDFKNVDGATFYDTAGSAASAQSASQPLDSDLTAIAALATTAYGRALLELADQAALMNLLSAASTTAAGTVELATTTEATTGTDTTKAVTSAGVGAAIAALVDSSPDALNTLNELAAALGDDPNFATTVNSNIAAKQDKDTDLTAIAGLVSAADKLPYATGAGTWAMTSLTTAGRSLIAGTDAAAQRTTLNVYSQTDIGDVGTDFVATFEAGLA